MATTTQTQGWHVGQWGVWGWLETIIKLIGIGAGIVALVSSLAAPDFIFANNPRLAAIIVAGLFLLLALVTITMRIQQREIISVIFAVLNIVGHIGIVVALLRLPTATTLPLVFAAAFALGEVVKMQFLARTGFTEAGRTPSQMQMIPRAFLAFYVLMIIFLVI